MTQVDILLRSLPEEYDICVGREHSYDIILRDKGQTHDIYVHNLVDRQVIYGDELDPLIFRLTESTVECLLDVSLLETALLYRYDDRLLSSLDNYPLFVLEHGGGYNYFNLKGTTVGLKKTMYAKLREHITKLISNVDIAVAKVIDTGRNNLTLSTSGDITKVTSIEISELSAKLTNQITTNMVNICELMLNASGAHWFDGYLYEYDDRLLSDMDLSYPKMSLISSGTNVYVKVSFDLEENTMRLGSSVSDIGTSVSFKDTVRNIMQLSADADFTYQFVCSCNPIITSLSESDISIDIISYVSPEAIATEITDWITQDIHTEIALGVNSQSKLNTSITDEMEAYYGLGQYDDRYLYYWDDYTISDMGAEIINRS